MKEVRKERRVITEGKGKKERKESIYNEEKEVMLDKMGITMISSWKSGLPRERKRDYSMHLFSFIFICHQRTVNAQASLHGV